jgi:catechol 2,3-dioxygenase-like lactoylglutathione lyase family enzyme
MSALNAIRNLDYIILFARDMAALRRFYGEVMEFPQHRTLGPQWVEYRVGGSTLAITERGMMFDDAAPEPGTLSVQLAFRVAPAEVTECAAAFAAKGIEAIWPVTDQPWGHRTLFVRDPDGNVVEIYAEI